MSASPNRPHRCQGLWPPSLDRNLTIVVRSIRPSGFEDPYQTVVLGSHRKSQYGTAPLRTHGVALVRITVGKLRGLQQISDDTGRFTMIAMDQRGSLQKMLHPDNPKAATYAEVEAVKLGVTEALAPHASGYLLDPDYGVAPAVNRFALPGRTGLLVALEQSGYEKKGNWRLTTLLEGWSVEKVKRLEIGRAHV